MAATFTWTIAQMERNVADGGVVVAHWRVSAEETVGKVTKAPRRRWRAFAEETVGEDTYTASAYGTCGFTPDPSSPDFVPYDSLTEDFVLHWVWHQIDKDETEARLADDIAGQFRIRVQHINTAAGTTVDVVDDVIANQTGV